MEQEVKTEGQLMLENLEAVAGGKRDWHYDIASIQLMGGTTAGGTNWAGIMIDGEGSFWTKL